MFQIEYRVYKSLLLNMWVKLSMKIDDIYSHFIITKSSIDISMFDFALQFSQYSDGLRAGLGFDSRLRQDISLFTIGCRPAMGPTQPPIRVLGLFYERKAAGM